MLVLTFAKPLPAISTTALGLPRATSRHIPLRRDPRERPAHGDQLERYIGGRRYTWTVIEATSERVTATRDGVTTATTYMDRAAWWRLTEGARVVLAEPQHETAAEAVARWRT